MFNSIFLTKKLQSSINLAALQGQNICFDERQNFQNKKVNNQTLIKFHKIYGNKWKEISNHLFNTSDSFIKNMFYTLARKALRKINSYIQLDSKIKTKKPKLFKLNFVFKLANLAQSQRISCQKENISTLQPYYTKLLYNLLDIGKLDTEGLKNLFYDAQLNIQQEDFKRMIDSLIENLRIIEKIFIQQNLIKKGKTKKKFPKKGLVQKAYSSKAFQNTLEDSQTKSFLSFTSSQSKQHKTDQIRIQQFEGLEMVQQLEIPFELEWPIKDELDNYLNIKAFDPILFQ